MNNSRTKIGIALAATAVILLSGCMSTDSPTAPETVAVDYTESSASWAPKEPIDHPTYTDAEQLEWRQQWLESLAAQSDIQDPPEIDLIRWTTTPQDAGHAAAVCLTEAGFPASYDEAAGGIIFDGGGVPDSQTEALNSASFVCNSQYTPVPGLRTDWNADQLGLLYDYWTEAYVPCVEARGYAVEEPPSREVYVDTFYTVPDNRWYPEIALWNLPEAERDEVSAACPIMPAPEHFYG